MTESNPVVARGRPRVLEKPRTAQARLSSHDYKRLTELEIRGKAVDGSFTKSDVLRSLIRGADSADERVVELEGHVKNADRELQRMRQEFQKASRKASQMKALLTKRLRVLYQHRGRVVGLAAAKVPRRSGILALDEIWGTYGRDWDIVREAMDLAHSGHDPPPPTNWRGDDW